MRPAAQQQAPVETSSGNKRSLATCLAQVHKVVSRKKMFLLVCFLLLRTSSGMGSSSSGNNKLQSVLELEGIENEAERSWLLDQAKGNFKWSQLQSELIMRLPLESLFTNGTTAAARLRPETLSRLVLQRNYDPILLKHILDRIKEMSDGDKVSFLDHLSDLDPFAWTLIGNHITSPSNWRRAWWSRSDDLLRALTFNLKEKENRLRLLLELHPKWYISCSGLGDKFCISPTTFSNKEKYGQKLLHWISHNIFHVHFPRLRKEDQIARFRSWNNFLTEFDFPEQLLARNVPLELGAKFAQFLYDEQVHRLWLRAVGIRLGDKGVTFRDLPILLLFPSTGKYPSKEPASVKFELLKVLENTAYWRELFVDADVKDQVEEISAVRMCPVRDVDCFQISSLNNLTMSLLTLGQKRRIWSVNKAEKNINMDSLEQLLSYEKMDDSALKNILLKPEAEEILDLLPPSKLRENLIMENLYQWKNSDLDKLKRLPPLLASTMLSMMIKKKTTTADEGSFWDPTSDKISGRLLHGLHKTHISLLPQFCIRRVSVAFLHSLGQRTGKKALEATQMEALEALGARLENSTMLQEAITERNGGKCFILPPNTPLASSSLLNRNSIRIHLSGERG